jgi:hypothetical protein
VTRSSALALASLLLAGCPSGAQSNGKSRPVDGGQKPEANGPKYDLAIEAPAKATKGSSGTARIAISPRAPWHVNLDYVPKLKIASPGGIALDRAEQKGPDAERFDADGLAFVVPFRAEDKGAQQIAGELQFAMCADDACAPETVPVAFTIDVGCDAGVVC